MGLRERVALIILGICLLQIYSSYCMPKVKNDILLTDSFKRRKNGILASKPNPINTRKQSNAENEYKSILKIFSFPEIEYPDVPFHGLESIVKNVDDEKGKSNTPGLTAQNHLKKGKSKVKYNSHIKLPIKDPLTEFSNTPNYRDIGKFPDVEYPLHASEMWKPNYWNGLTNTPSNKQSNYKSESKNKKRTTKTSDKLLINQLTSKRKKDVKSSNNLTSKKVDIYKKNEVSKEYLLPSEDDILLPADVRVNNSQKGTTSLKLVDPYTTAIPNHLRSNSSSNNSLASNICSLEYKKDSFTVYDGSEKLVDMLPVVTPPTFDTLYTACPYRNDGDFAENQLLIATKHPKDYSKSDENFLTSTTVVPMLTCLYNDNTNMLSINRTKTDKNKNITINCTNKKKENEILFVKNNDDDVTNTNSNISVDFDEEFTTDDPEFYDNSIRISTIAPMTSNTIDLWKKSEVLEPKKVATVDELEDYFISV